MIDKLIETKKELANNWKMKMDYYQKIIDEVNPFELTEFLNANCSMNFAKGMYMALTREIQDLEELKPKIDKKSLLAYLDYGCGSYFELGSQHEEFLKNIKEYLGVDIDE